MHRHIFEKECENLLIAISQPRNVSSNHKEILPVNQGGCDGKDICGETRPACGVLVEGKWQAVWKTARWSITLLNTGYIEKIPSPKGFPKEVKACRNKHLWVNIHSCISHRAKRWKRALFYQLEDKWNIAYPHGAKQFSQKGECMLQHAWPVNLPREEKQDTKVTCCRILLWNIQKREARVLEMRRWNRKWLWDFLWGWCNDLGLNDGCITLENYCIAYFKWAL